MATRPEPCACTRTRDGYADANCRMCGGKGGLAWPPSAEDLAALRQKWEREANDPPR